MASRRRKKNGTTAPASTPPLRNTHPPTSPSESFGRPVAALLVAMAVLFNAFILRGVLASHPPDINDMVLHRLLAEIMADAITEGRNWLDPWVPNIALGYPVWHAYQPLPHLLGALLTLITGGDVQFATSVLLYLSLSLFPLAVYVSARWLGLTLEQAAFAALVTPLVNAGGRYGLEYRSYVWSGSGLYTQAFAQAAFALAVGASWRAFRTGHRLVLAGALMAAAFLCHSVYGFIAVASAPLMVPFVPRADRRKALVRMSVVLAVAALGVAFFVLPLLADREGINRSRWEEPWKWDSYGAAAVLEMLIDGDLFDGGKLPLLTLAVLAGLGVLLYGRTGGGRFVVCAFGVWLILYFGRATWGRLYDLIPMSTDLPQHRLIAGVHLFGVFAAGSAVGKAVEWVARARGRAWIPAACASVLLLLTPAILRQIHLLQQDRQWREENAAAWEREKNDLLTMFSAMRQEDRGRVFAGLAGTWGKQDAVGFAPLFALTTSAGFETTSYLYHAMGAASDLMVLFDESRPEHYRALNVGWVVADARRDLPDFLEKAGQWGRFSLYRAPGGGAFEIYSSARARPAAPREHFAISEEWMRGNAVRDRIGFVLSSPWREGGDGGTSARGVIESARVSGERASAAVTLAAPAVVALKSTWHPRWRARVDDKAVDVLMVSPGFVAVAVPAGRHRIHLQYVTQSWRTPLALVGWLIIIVAAILEWRKVIFPDTVAGLERRIAGERSVSGAA
jgi:hypothetical protein